jgi:cell division topological specificity factor MinE
MKENNIINNVVSYNSGLYAKERLKSILMADRIGCTPDVITHIKDDISRIVSGYVDIDAGNMTVQLTDSLLMARIPVLGIHMKREKEKHESDKDNETNG